MSYVSRFFNFRHGDWQQLPDFIFSNLVDEPTLEGLRTSGLTKDTLISAIGGKRCTLRYRYLRSNIPVLTTWHDGKMVRPFPISLNEKVTSTQDEIDDALYEVRGGFNVKPIELDALLKSAKNPFRFKSFSTSRQFSLGSGFIFYPSSDTLYLDSDDDGNPTYVSKVRRTVTQSKRSATFEFTVGLSRIPSGEDKSFQPVSCRITYHIHPTHTPFIPFLDEEVDREDIYDSFRSMHDLPHGMVDLRVIDSVLHIHGLVGYAGRRNEWKPYSFFEGEKVLHVNGRHRLNDEGLELYLTVHKSLANLVKLSQGHKPDALSQLASASWVDTYLK